MSSSSALFLICSSQAAQAVTGTAMPEKKVHFRSVQNTSVVPELNRVAEKLVEIE